MIKLVIFDLWKTLAYKNAHMGSIDSILQKMNLEIQKNKLIKIFEGTVQTKRWRSKDNAYKQLCINMGLSPTKINVEILKKIRDNVESKIKIYDYSIPMLKSLRKQGYKIGLISNSTVFSIRNLRKVSTILNYIDYKVFSYNIGAIKPDPKAFKEIMRLSSTKPNECLMIGDNKFDDVIPSQKLGMNAIWLRNYNQLEKDLKKFDIII